MRSPRNDALSLIPSEPWSASFAVMTRTHPATRRNSIDRLCLATGAKRSVVKMDNMVWHLYVFLSWRSTVGQSVQHFSFIHFTRDFINFTVFVCGVSDIWEMCSSAQILMRHFIFSLHQSNLWLTLLFCCCPTMQCMTSMCEAVTYECKKSPVRACALASFTVMHCESKMARRKYANRFGRNLFRNHTDTDTILAFVWVFKHVYVYVSWSQCCC